MSVMILWLFVVSSAGFVMPSPKCHPRMGAVRALRATLPQNDESSLEDPTTKELFGVVTRAELSLGISDLRGVIERLAEKQSTELKFVATEIESLAEKQSTEIESLAEKQSTELKFVAEKQSTELKFVAFLGAVLGVFGYWQLSEKISKLSPEVDKMSKVATEFDLYKTGANGVVAAIIGALVTIVVASISAYFKSRE